MDHLAYVHNKYKYCCDCKEGHLSTNASGQRDFHFAPLELPAITSARVTLFQMHLAYAKYVSDAGLPAVRQLLIPKEYYIYYH